MNAVDTLRLIGSVAGEANLTVGMIFGLIKGVRDAWPTGTGEVLPTDAELIAAMRDGFAGNMTRNDELQTEILAGNLPEPPA